MARSKKADIAQTAALSNGSHISTIHNGSSLLDTLAASPHELLYPSPDIHSAALRLAKFYLDPIASSISEAQIARRDEARQSFKRKRNAGEFEDEDDEREMERDKKGADLLRIRCLTVEGFEAQQVWEQVNQVARAVDGEVERLQRRIEREKHKYGGEESSGEAGDSDSSEEEDFVEEERTSKEVHFLSGQMDDEEHDDEELGLESDDDDEEKNDVERFVKDKFGLNDGFFSIDEFNRRTEALEELDARGEPEAPSDEEDIDWDADPAGLSLGATERSRNDAGDTDDEEHEDDDEDDESGPTFGNMDLDAPEGASEAGINDKEDEKEDGENLQNLKYADFFDPPPNAVMGREKSRRKTKPKKSSITNGAHYDEFENDIQRTMRKLQSDEFDDESESGVPANASTHEKRRAALLAQIRQLEAENIAKKSWTLMGEARAQDRPLDAALDEDLEFERTGKPLPIVTKETSEAIEELIKRRIVADDYDEVRKRRPEDVYGSLNKPGRKDTRLDDNLDTPRRRGLAEIYEEEHLRRTDSAYVDEKSEKRNNEHAEIEALWKDISSKLDSLTSWNYKPKPPEMSVKVRADAPAISLEDARPSGTGGEVGALNQLAPQEVFAPGNVKEAGKIVTKGGTVLDRAELSRDQRKRIRQREKERVKKRLSGHQEKRNVKSKNTQSTVVTNLKKGGVRIISKKGELQDVDGNELKDDSRKDGNNLRL